MILELTFPVYETEATGFHLVLCQRVNVYYTDQSYRSFKKFSSYCNLILCSFQRKG